jgi:hypothetical protein
MKKGLINEAFRLQQLAGLIKEDFNLGLQKEQDSKGEVINLYNLDLETLPDEVEDIIDKGSIGNEEYIVNVRKRPIDFQEESEEDFGDNYDELQFWYAVEKGILSDKNLLANVEIGGTYVDNVPFYDQGDGYVVVENDYLGYFGVITKQAADEAIQYMKTL